ncbi:amyloid-beta A4 precursor protein-binding family A member 2-like isoform X3 [Mya arenaria]|uniref:amyloid-beta A4 precursor protein-binding family A member 2-like isoform X3 n=1 Tax=Mya arenaria TaxID=6604 RepID=UPI0022E6BEE1|nr:amyloid-beta A4 precursor protein-binding family A member 2-like isoform X3 [Mya arenaria]
MSDTEDRKETNIKQRSEEQCEGAYGEDAGLRPSTPCSDKGDNISMEVRFSEGSSHHASDLSSVSYQNLLDDVTTCGNISRRDSEDSVDSYLQDYNEDIQKPGDPNTQCDALYKDSISERISTEVTRKENAMKTDNFNLMKSTNSVRSDPGPEAYNLSELRTKPNVVDTALNVQDSFRKHELVVTMRDQQRSRSLPPGDESIPTEKKRNSLEIRNNIPVAGEIKNYEKDIGIDGPSFNSHGAKPKMKKQSPGLACRVEVTAEDTNKMDSNATAIINELIQKSKANANVLNESQRKIHNKDSNDDFPGTVQQNGHFNPVSADIINEYEYVKYSRIQEGNSYVGMRLAYSSSESDSQCHRSVDGVDEYREHLAHGDNGEIEAHSGHFSPESNLLHNNANLLEETLDEIPLNGPDGVSGKGDKLFTLSPENTECDSVEIESVVSDGDGETTGMPNVEDGLSSSQTSDNEDNVRSEHNTPKKILQKRQQEEVERRLYGVECAAIKPKEMDAEAIMDDLKMKREALDHAISEIKFAIQKSKGVSLEAPYKEDDSEDIWVKREEPATKTDGSSPYKVANGSPEREDRCIEPTFQDGELRQMARAQINQIPPMSSSEEHVYEKIPEKERILEKKFTRNEGKLYHTPKDFDTDEETDQLLEKQYQGNQYVDIPELSQPPVNRASQAEKRKSRAKEVQINDPENPSVLIEGVLFRARYLGSTQLISEGQPSKAMRMMQAQEAVGRIKAPEGENQPSTDVDLFVSTEKIMVLNTDLQEIMMDHSLRTISYIADIGDILVIMARRRLIGSPSDTDSMRRRKQAKIICHVFESEEAQLIAQSIGQAFQVAYMEFLKANGIEDQGLLKEIDYQEVLNQQQIYGEELSMFSNKENQKEVIVPKVKGEQLGVVIVESGWGSMVPTVVLANMSPTGPSARCGQLNIGDQIISVNGISLVGLPLSACQSNIKGTRHQTVVKLTVVPCPPVVEVLIKRPDVKYQLGFSVQNGVICSLLRGGIAERGGVRVGHRIIEINNQSVVAVPHEKIVSLLANSVGEIHMKTMPTSIFRLLTGQETPHYL